MKSNHKIVLAVLAGISIGAAVSNALRAQQPKPLPAYVVAEVEVTDPATFDTYAKQVAATLVPFGGHPLARGGKIVPVEGEPPKRVAVPAFESVEKAQAWEDSPAYSAIRPIRQRSAKSRIFIVEGLNPQ